MCKWFHWSKEGSETPNLMPVTYNRTPYKTCKKLVFCAPPAHFHPGLRPLKGGEKALVFAPATRFRSPGLLEGTSLVLRGGL